MTTYVYIPQLEVFTQIGRLDSLAHLTEAIRLMSSLLASEAASVQYPLIRTALQTIDRKLAHHERKRDTLQELFKSLLHELMTGRIRVHDLDIDTTALIGEPTGGEDK